MVPFLLNGHFLAFFRIFVWERCAAVTGLVKARPGRVWRLLFLGLFAGGAEVLRLPLRLRPHQTLKLGREFVLGAGGNAKLLDNAKIRQIQLQVRVALNV